MMEEWRDIAGYEGLYQVSNQGRVKSLKRWDVNKKIFVDGASILKPTDNGNSYLIIGLRNNTKRKNHYIHRLVAGAFLDNPYGLKYVNHIDYNTRNNDVSNLEWCSQKENVRHSSNRMSHLKTVTHSNTGERYITNRKGRYRVIVSKKEYGSFLSLDDAIKKRDSILNGGDAICLSQL